MLSTGYTHSTYLCCPRYISTVLRIYSTGYTHSIALTGYTHIIESCYPRDMPTLFNYIPRDIPTLCNPPDLRTSCYPRDRFMARSPRDESTVFNFVSHGVHPRDPKLSSTGYSHNYVPTGCHTHLWVTSCGGHFVSCGVLPWTTWVLSTGYTLGVVHGICPMLSTGHEMLSTGSLRYPLHFRHYIPWTTF